MVRSRRDDEDAFSRYWRKRVFWQRGELKKSKRLSAKRERRIGRAEAAEK